MEQQIGEFIFVAMRILLQNNSSESLKNWKLFIQNKHSNFKKV